MAGKLWNRQMVSNARCRCCRGATGWQDRHMELPDFHIPHAEKIEWMIETNGLALEPVPPDPAAQPPSPAYSYTIGVPASLGFPEIVVFGLAPAAANGLITLVLDAVRGGTVIPLGIELIGLLDNDLRCFFASIDVETYGDHFATAHSWYQGQPYSIVQLLYPDRAGTMPYEPAFEERLRLAQPIIGDTTPGG